MAIPSRDREKQRHWEEVRKMDFEIVKHIATLDIATAVVLLTIHREIGIEKSTLVQILSMFFLSAVAAVVSMIGIRNRVAKPNAEYGLWHTRIDYLIFAGSI